MKDRKIVFIGKSGYGIEKVYNELSKICNLVHLTNYLDYKLVTVYDQIDYRVATIVGNLLVKRNSYNVKWVDNFGMQKPADNFCVVRLTKMNLGEDADFKAENFAKSMSKEVKIPVRYKFDEDSKKYEIYISVSDICDDPNVSYNKILEILVLKMQKIELFVENNLETYTAELIDFDGRVIKTKRQEAEDKMNALEEYYTRSALCKGIYFPEGLNLSPKINDDDYFDDDYFEDEFYIGSYSYRLKYVKKSDFERGDSQEAGLFTRNIEYGVNYEEHYQRDKYYEFDDVVNVKYCIDVLDEDELRVSSTANGIRKTKGKKLTKYKGVYDELLKGVKTINEDCEYGFEAIDYYKIIAPNTLLHYTNISKFYETYEIPVGFSFFDSMLLDNFSNKVYDDDASDWINYDDISEVIANLTK